MAQVNVTEYLRISGGPITLERERSLAVTLAAHFELIAREGDPEACKTRLEAVQLHLLWWIGQPHPDDPEYCTEMDRRYGLMLWLASNELRVAEDKAYTLVREKTS